MKIKVTMKTPDCLYSAIKDYVEEDIEPTLREDERAAVIELRVDRIKDIAYMWFKHGEYLTVEIDTEAKTCVVVPQ